jgi:hypothetical protein
MAKNVWGLEDLDMSRIWRDIQTHRWAALVYLVYWILTLATIVITWNQGIPGAVVALVLTNPLIACALVVWWRVATPEKAANPVERFRVGMLTGVLSTEITFLVMKGGAGAELDARRQISRNRGFGVCDSRRDVWGRPGVCWCSVRHGL